MSELSEFVLDALRQAGALVDAPLFGVYDALLPEELAERWQVPAFQRLAFDDQAGPEVPLIGYGHPLVETLMDAVRAEPACTRVFVRGLRLDKRGLLALARQSLSLPNARLAELPRQAERVAECHYVRWNFKAALVTDEKREQLVSVVMDVQAGFAVPELAQLERRAQLEGEAPADRHLPEPPHWLPGQVPLGEPVLAGLLERSTAAAVEELAGPLQALSRRAARHLELDRARLNEYYDTMARDLQRRLDRAGDGSSDTGQRQAALADKLAATEAERQAKLADVEAKYRPRVELELINLQVIHQPKVLLTVQIANRTASVQRTVAWDPLLHRLEPLACDVCGRAGTRLMLCSGGHLAHEECLHAEQCIDCKRVYCRLCAGRMDRCAVCERPVCLLSLNRCGQCGRGTCREHVNLCHADAGQPARLAPAPTPPPAAPKPGPPPPPPPADRKEPPPRRVKDKGSARGSQPTRAPVPLEAARVTPARIEVYSEADGPQVTAFVLTQGGRQVAVRAWHWQGQSIEVTCNCERQYLCANRVRILDPEPGIAIEAQLRAEIDELRREYGIALRRVVYHTVTHGQPRQVPRLTLQGDWKPRET